MKELISHSSRVEVYLPTKSVFILKTNIGHNPPCLGAHEKRRRMMFTFTEHESDNFDPLHRSLQNLAEVCKAAYEAGLTLQEVQSVSGAAWADFLDPRESESYRISC